MFSRVEHVERVEVFNAETQRRRVRREFLGPLRGRERRNGGLGAGPQI